VIQQRYKEVALQVQAQQMQAALPTLLAVQALAYQQQLATNQLSTSSPLTTNIAHPGTKFNNRPLVRYSDVRPSINISMPTMTMPIVRPSISPCPLRSRSNMQHTVSNTFLPTYKQVQEIERGITLDKAIHLKNAIEINNASELDVSLSVNQ
jgi:hypothetical protein